MTPFIVVEGMDGYEYRASSRLQVTRQLALADVPARACR